MFKAVSLNLKLTRSLDWNQVLIPNFSIVWNALKMKMPVDGIYLATFPCNVFTNKSASEEGHLNLSELLPKL